ncbi:hypothetical protein [Streptomyces pinistramenti]|uniref:hypothetical protein n=1 Tax=Streptomyces pinistramenti TaxID=2884812 RepID=UPI001D076A07|nr:hypothetical protein [Streptomyces pinistramenti]MCB5911426.1 hypothetical protein [Streptomyces pinistramenti]
MPGHRLAAAVPEAAVERGGALKGNKRIGILAERTLSVAQGDEPEALREGRITCVLDFEHATYAERFRDFGKLDEHIFDAFPAGRDVFLASYAAACPLPDDWEQRVALGQVLHALNMHVYFRRWSPQWAPQYARQVKEWLTRNT